MRAFKLKLKDLFLMKNVYKLLLFLTVFWFLVSYDTNLYRLSVILDYLDFREIQFLSNQSLYSSLKYEPGDRAILNTLHRLQHPLKCSDQRLLIFDANTWHCGFGCSLHTIVYQLHLAYQTNRTLIVKNSHILNYFEAIGVNCPFNSDAINSQVIRIAEDDVVYVNRRQSAIKSKDISLELLKKTAEKYSNIHKEPVAWLIGQFVSYIMQYSFEFQMRAARYQTQMGFKTSCVGVHVRRTDKAEEARLFELADYMQHVSLYYKAKQEKYSNGTRCVFLITDDMDIIAEAKTKCDFFFENIFSNC